MQYFHNEHNPETVGLSEVRQNFSRQNVSVPRKHPAFSEKNDFILPIQNPI